MIGRMTVEELDLANARANVLLECDKNTLDIIDKHYQQEIERLNNIINEFENKGYDIAQERADFLLEIDRLNNIIKIMEKYFELIVDLGYDYDGFNKIEDLKMLINELVKYAGLGRVYNTTEPIFINRDKKYNILNEELKGE